MSSPAFPFAIFDLDGTLLNTLDDLADSCNWVCRQHGWPEHTRDEYRYFVGKGIPHLVRCYVPEDWRTPERVEQVLAEYVPYYSAHRADRTAPYPGILEMLERLKAAGVQTAVLSNKAHHVTAPLIEEYFPGLFPFVQGALEGVPLKPDPALLHILMERMGADPERTLMVGDSGVDVETAKNGGLPVCGVLWGFRSRPELEQAGVDFTVPSAEDLTALILGERT